MFLLGADPCLLALAVGLPDEVATAALRLRRQVAADAPAARPWVSHLPLSRRLARRDLPRALDLVWQARSGAPADGTARSLR